MACERRTYQINNSLGIEYPKAVVFLIAGVPFRIRFRLCLARPLFVPAC